jgi:hydroxyquinol 1,2-dioxygenase
VQQQLTAPAGRATVVSVTDQPATSTPERRNLTDADLTKAVVASFDATPDPRLREVLQALVRNLHAFAAEVELTEDEWFAAIDFLTRTGHMCDDRRQEFVLASDVLGLSMLVIGINHRHPTGATESTVFGPFFVEGSPAFENGDDLANGAPGTPCFMSGSVRSTTGEPVAGALLEIWQADEDGLYDVQYADLDEPRGRGHLQSDGDGCYWFWTVHPEAYPIPTDGPVGELLAATSRSPMRPAHVHFKVTAPGYQTLITHVFDEADRYLDTDAVFGVRSSLLAAFERHDPGTAPDGREMGGPWASASFDLVLAPSSTSARGPRPPS